MADPLAAPLVSSVSASERAPRLGASLALVIAYWWIATGFTIAVQQSDTGRVIALVATTLLAIFGTTLIARSRDQLTPHSARLAFFGAALIWCWGAALFYGGVGLRIPDTVAGASGSAALAVQAIAATWRADLVMVVALALLAICLWKRPNRVALWTLAAFWGTLQTAKLNVFFGVRNSGAEMLPARLTRLSVFFGPGHNSPLLLPTLLFLIVLTIALIMRTTRANSAFTRHAMGMMALLILLALVEHVALGIPTRLPLWDIFLPAAT